MTEPSITFDLVVEGKSEDPTQVAPDEYHFPELTWSGESPPDLVMLADGTPLVKVGRYASAGRPRFRYREADTALLVDRGPKGAGAAALLTVNTHLVRMLAGPPKTT